MRYMLVRPKYYQNFYDWYRSDYYQRNITQIDNIVANDAQISNFTGSNYATITLPDSSSFEFILKFNTGSTPEGTIFSMYGNTNKFGIAGGKLGFVNNTPAWVYTSITPSADTTYWARLVFSNSQVSVSFQVDNNYTLATLPNSWTGTITASSQSPSGKMIYLGRSSEVDAGAYPWYGSIDLSGCRIKDNLGSRVWQGIKSGTKPLDFIQPTLTNSNGDFGGVRYGVDASSVLGTDYVYRAFDKTSATYWHSASGLPQWIAWYNPTPINVTKIKITNSSSHTSHLGITGGKIRASNDGINWTDVKTFTNSETAIGTEWFIYLSDNTEYYNYYMIYVTSSAYNNQYALIAEIKIYGKSYDWNDEVLLASNTRTYDGEYTRKELVEQLVADETDYDEIVNEYYCLTRKMYYQNFYNWYQDTPEVNKSDSVGTVTYTGSLYSGEQGILNFNEGVKSCWSSSSGSVTYTYDAGNYLPIGEYTIGFGFSYDTSYPNRKLGNPTWTVTYSDNTTAQIFYINGLYNTGDYTATFTASKPIKALTFSHSSSSVSTITGYVQWTLWSATYLLASNTRTYDGEYTRRELVNQVVADETDYDEKVAQGYSLRRV